MINIKIIGKPKSFAAKTISKEAEIPIYKGNDKTELLINYGLAGTKLDDFLNRYPLANSIPTLNKYVGCSKLQAVKEAETAGVRVPESRTTLPLFCKKSDWIEKKLQSSKGIGIVEATKRVSIPGKYYQKKIDRKYELRVHAFKWIPKEEWHVHKRLGSPDKIAWNFHQGGKFKTVHTPQRFDVFRNAVDISETILKIRKMSFGAVDFLVTPENEVYFIEINSSPGFTELSKHIYVDAFSALKTMTLKEAIKVAI